jgi:H+/gluconate symporter-like permease
MVVVHTAIAIAIIILLIIKIKVDPVISLIIGSIYLGLVQRGVSSLMVRGVTMWHAGDASGAA